MTGGAFRMTGGQVRTQQKRRSGSRSFAALRMTGGAFRMTVLRVQDDSAALGMTGCKVRLLFHGLNDQFPIGCIDLDCISIANGTVEDATGNTVLNLFLDDALERARSILRVVALGCQQVFRFITQVQGDMTVYQAWS